MSCALPVPRSGPVGSPVTLMQPASTCLRVGVTRFREILVMNATTQSKTVLIQGVVAVLVKLAGDPPPCPQSTK